MVSKLTNDVLLFVLAMVSSREREMLRMRYGLDGFPPCSWAEVAEAYGIPVDRAYGVERKALQRARAALS
jgi:DNA-directed RNA polymerase sigma subunit (sigma70/sigma32)